MANASLLLSPTWDLAVDANNNVAVVLELAASDELVVRLALARGPAVAAPAPSLETTIEVAMSAA